MKFSDVFRFECYHFYQIIKLSFLTYLQFSSILMGIPYSLFGSYRGSKRIRDDDDDDEQEEYFKAPVRYEVY